MSHKLSFYTVFTNPIDDKGSRVGFSTRTSRTMKVSAMCYDFMQNDLIEHIPGSVLDKLVEHKIVVDADEDELATIIHENQHHIEGGSKEDLYEVIQPTAFCQLGCYYCGQQHTKTNLSDDLVDKVVERIVFKYNKGNYKGIYIGWFGGEPLVGLPQMRAINKKLRLAFEGRDVPIAGKVVTNGLSLKENIFLELVGDFKINQFEITLDGTADFHDKHRYTKAGGESFDIIYGNLTRILNREDFRSFNCTFSIRCNVDEKNVDGVVPLIRKLAADGLHKKIGYLYFAAIYSWAGNDAHKKSLTKEEFSKLYLEWFVLKTQLGYHTTHQMPRRKLQTCIAVGGPSEMYDAYGNTFNCTEVSYTDFYDNTPYNLGNLKNDHLKEHIDKPLNAWNNDILDGTQQPCHNCRMLPVCGGACPKSWKENNTACPPFKYNIKKELELRYIMKRTEPALLNEKLDEFVTALDIDDFTRLY